MVGLIPPAPMFRLQHLAGRVVLAVALMLAAASTALADKRVALVLGVSNYQSVARLANPDNDAAAISDVFKRMGFDIVELRRDLGVIEMRRAVRDFAAVAADSDMAVVYYAGHGIEVNGANFLIPADARLQSDFDVEDEAVAAGPDSPGDKSGEAAAARHPRCLPRQSVCGADDAQCRHAVRWAAALPRSSPRRRIR